MERAVAVKIVDRIDGVVLLAEAAARIERRLRRARGVAGAVDEIEFQLQRDAGHKVHLAETGQNVLQRSARLAGGRRAVVVAHGGQHLQARRTLAPDAAERAGHRPGGAIRVAVAEAAAERIHHLALDVHQIDRARQLHAGLEQARCVGQRQALAAHGAGDVDDQRVDAFEARMGRRQPFELGARGVDEGGMREARDGGCLVHRRIIGRRSVPTK